MSLLLFQQLLQVLDLLNQFLPNRQHILNLPMLVANLLILLADLRGQLLDLRVLFLAGLPLFSLLLGQLLDICSQLLFGYGDVVKLQLVHRYLLNLLSQVRCQREDFCIELLDCGLMALRRLLLVVCLLSQGFNLLLLVSYLISQITFDAPLLFQLACAACQLCHLFVTHILQTIPFVISLVQLHQKLHRLLGLLLALLADLLEICFPVLDLLRKELDLLF